MHYTLSLQLTTEFLTVVGPEVVDSLVDIADMFVDTVADVFAEIADADFSELFETSKFV
jgi:hypothetical protein